MAKMIPSRIDDNQVSAGERRIFRLLECDPATTNWIVIHSLGIARRRIGPYGEIDFVVIVPGEGVICLEVKGGRLSCEEGVWRTKDRFGRMSILNKSPFMQARESMFALRKAIEHHFGKGSRESRCPIGCGVVFPDVICPPLTPEFERTDVIDHDDLRQPISRSIVRISRYRLREFQPNHGTRLPTAPEVEAIKSFLRPDFELIVAKGVSVGRTEEKLLSMTKEQYARLDELEANPRCLFEGAAGTGKTLLALEYVRRASSNGLNVALVCFNRLLGEWMQQQIDSKAVAVGTWHGLLRRLILQSVNASEFQKLEQSLLRSNDTTALFSEMYPFYGELALGELGTQYDIVVMDEAQDLCTPQTLDTLNLAMNGGLAGGRWALFGDFTRQAIYRGEEKPVVSLSRYCDHFVQARLTLNCRNTQRIAEETTILAGFDRLPFRLGEEIGLSVEHRYWKKNADFVKSLGNVVEQLVKEGIPIDNLIILSPHRLENSSLARVERLSSFPIVDISRGRTESQHILRFSTIHSFKGLESSVVIIVDVDQVDSEESRSLFYVAMSRARSLLILMVHEGSRRSLERRIKEGMLRELNR